MRTLLNITGGGSMRMLFGGGFHLKQLVRIPCQFKGCLDLCDCSGDYGSR